MNILSIRRPGTLVAFEYEGEIHGGKVLDAFRPKYADRLGHRPHIITVETDRGWRGFELRGMSNVMVG
jgi:hypothetical protein